MTKKILLPGILLLVTMGSIAQKSSQNLPKEGKSPIIPIILKSPIPAPAASQAKDRLLWYTGKKVNDSILITPDATLVLYSKKREMVVVQPPSKKDPSLKIIQQMNDIHKHKKELVNNALAKKNSVFLYPHITAAFNEFDKQNEEYSTILKNVVDLPAPLASTAYSKQNVSGGVASYIKFNFAIIPEYIKNAFHEVMASMKNYPSIDFTSPPAMEFGSCSTQCDSNAWKKMESKEAEWLKSFTEYETGIVKKSISIMRKMHELKLESDPEAASIFTGLEKAMEFAFARATNKVDLLIRKYGNDFSRLPVVIRATLGIERQKQLIGIGEDKYSATVQRLLSLLDGFEKYIEQQMDARNYDFVFNVAFIIGVERQRQLLGGSEKNDNGFESYFKKLEAFNRFRLSINIDYAANTESIDCGPEDEVSARLATPSNVYVSIAPLIEANGHFYCKFLLYMKEVEHTFEDASYFRYGDDYEGPGADRYLLPLNVSSFKHINRHINDEDNCVTGAGTANAGQKELKMTLPYTRFSFCKDETEDTLILGGWKQSVIVNDLSRFIILYPASESENENDALVKKAMQYAKDIKNPAVSSTGYAGLDPLQKNYEKVKMTQELREQVGLLIAPGSIIKFNAENKSSTLITTNQNLTFVYAGWTVSSNNISIKVEHDPLPYK